jgi:hypothetical protein
LAPTLPALVATANWNKLRGCLRPTVVVEAASDHVSFALSRQMDHPAGKRDSA